MSIPFAALIGAVFGAFRARRRNGSTADMLQWAAVYAAVFALGMLFLSIFIIRSIG